MQIPFSPFSKAPILTLKLLLLAEKTDCKETYLKWIMTASLFLKHALTIKILNFQRTHLHVVHILIREECSERGLISFPDPPSAFVGSNLRQHHSTPVQKSDPANLK